MSPLQKAILRTVAYSDVFDYAPKGWEIHKWLINYKTNLHDVERGLKQLVEKGLLVSKNDLYALDGRSSLFKIRKTREENSAEFLKTAHQVSTFLKLIPWIKMVGVSGGLARKNVDWTDDIDLFIVTEKYRIWSVRLLTLLILSVLGIRRKSSQNSQNAAGRICVNLLLEEDRLIQDNRSIYIAHEVLQMAPLWQKANIYTKYLSDNEWALDMLPNWTSSVGFYRPDHQLLGDDSSHWWDYLEILSRAFQLKIMSPIRGSERVEQGALYFHPINYEEKVLDSYHKKLGKIGLSK